jgi:hypothetical protein
VVLQSDQCHFLAVNFPLETSGRLTFCKQLIAMFFCKSLFTAAAARATLNLGLITIITFHKRKIEWDIVRDKVLVCLRYFTGDFEIARESVLIDVLENINRLMVTRFISST